MVKNGHWIYELGEMGTYTPVDGKSFSWNTWRWVEESSDDRDSGWSQHDNGGVRGGGDGGDGGDDRTDDKKVPLKVLTMNATKATKPMKATKGKKPMETMKANKPMKAMKGRKPQPMKAMKAKTPPADAGKKRKA